ncbi:DUF2975 domain-containing protein [Herbiconiux sp. L3-i23]|uniref:DUF2975 domain-containing protein n=1 Tax=Herbiconiux sp. L3-i23 TaxID=2905871 RepID=UPI0020527F65|nr:DUF2975 domain-containing protein [Herbiconiux sp. L3-i23]BDI23688.1 hypothetical protein L3i23_24640 [Herbiconiux sp. L3-i23]
MSRLVIAGLRVLVVSIVFGILVVQVFAIPAIGRGVTSDAGLDEFGVAYAVAGIGVGVCLQVALVAVWALLSRVRRDAIFTDGAFRWVDVIIWSGVVATVLLTAVAAHIVLVVEPRLDAPGLIVIIGGAVILAAAFVLLMVVMRGLLRSATNLRDELAEVV